MEKMKKSILMMAALLMTGAAVISCDNVDNIVVGEQTNGARAYTMIVKASMGGDAQTRALVQDAQTQIINSMWTQGDKVEVYGYNDGTYKKLGELAAQSGGSSTTTLMGELSLLPDPDDDDTFVDLVRPSANFDYTLQVGTLENISAKHDFSIARQLKVTNIDNVNKTITAEPATGEKAFGNPQAIIKFTLKEGQADINAKSLIVNVKALRLDDQQQEVMKDVLLKSYDFLAGQKAMTQAESEAASTKGDITITPASSTNTIWAALSTEILMGMESEASEGGATISLIAVGGTTSDNLNNVYYYSKENVSISHSKFYNLSVPMTKLSVPLTKLTYIETSNQSADMLAITIFTNYAPIDYEQAWMLAKAQKAINGDNKDVLVLSRITYTSDETVAYYASSADPEAKQHSVTDINELKTLISNAGYYVHK